MQPFSDEEAQGAEELALALKNYCLQGDQELPVLSSKVRVLSHRLYRDHQAFQRFMQILTDRINVPYAGLYCVTPQRSTLHMFTLVEEDDTFFMITPKADAPNEEPLAATVRWTGTRLFRIDEAGDVHAVPLDQEQFIRYM